MVPTRDWSRGHNLRMNPGLPIGKTSTAEFRGGRRGGARSGNAQTSAVLRENLRVPPWLILSRFIFTEQCQMEQVAFHETSSPLAAA